MNRSTLRLAAPAVLLAAAVLLPFLGKAFTIDDTIFLREAEHAAVEPLHPTAFESCGATSRSEPRPPAAPSWPGCWCPPCCPWLPRRWPTSPSFLMLALAVLGTVALSLRLGVAPAWAAAAGLLLAATPTALAMAGTAMPDVPAMALGVLGVERLLAWKQERRVHQAVLAAVLLGLAPLTRSHLILLLGVGALLLVDDFLKPSGWRSTRWTAFVPVGAALLVTASVLWLTWDHDPGSKGLVGATRGISALDNLAPNTVAFATNWALALPLALPWLLLRPMAILRRWWLLLLGIGAMYLLWSSATASRSPNALAAGLGLAVLWDILADGWKRRDPIQVGLGLWLLLPLAPIPYPQLPPKLHLAAAPAAAILVVREMASRGRLHARLVLGATMAAGLALGVAILRADTAFAGLARRAVAELIVPQVAAGHRVWFVGHWGFQWYAENAGARIVTTTPPYPAPGDLLVGSRVTHSGVMVDPMLRRDFGFTRLATLEDWTPGGRLITEGAGFFSNNSGYLPWTWGTGLLDAFDLYRVEWTSRRDPAVARRPAGLVRAPPARRR